jgi:hypothetical protein
MSQRFESVTEERVVRYWLSLESRGRSDVPDPETVTRTEAVDALLSANPGAASFVWRERPIDWYRTTVDRERMLGVRPVGGPGDLLWRGLSVDGTLLGVAERIHEQGLEALSDETGVDLAAVATYRDRVADGGRIDPLVVRTRRGRTPWYVVDGNHRTTAIALHYLETGEYDPQPAYVAVTGNPVIRPILDRIGGLVQRLRGEPIGYRGRDDR